MITTKDPWSHFHIKNIPKPIKLFGKSYYMNSDFTVLLFMILSLKLLFIYCMVLSRFQAYNNENSYYILNMCGLFLR